jgi:hypothetical protein
MSAREGGRAHREERKRMRRSSVRSWIICCSTALTLASAASAGEIDFEDVAAQNDPAAVVTDEYAARGVTFVGTDGAVWQGVSAGDPGGFGIEGSKGPSFLGFDGASFAMEVHFDEPVRNVRFDLARGARGTFHFFFILHGYRDGELVDMAATVLGDVGVWQEVALAEEVDTLVWWSVGDFRYGVDDLRWDGMAPAVVRADIDLLPGSERNPIHLGRPGVVPVVLYGAPDLDLREVVFETLTFGPEDALPSGAATPLAGELEDVDGDGWLDGVLHPAVQEMDLIEGDERVCLLGELSDGRLLEGCDVVTPVGRGRP